MGSKGRDPEKQGREGTTASLDKSEEVSKLLGFA